MVKSIFKLLPLLAVIACASLSCTQKEEEKKKTHDGRWMDRTIYFAKADPSSPSRNNFFQKSKVQESLKEVEQASMLGEGYFKFEEIDESLLDTSLEEGPIESEQKSFVLIWPDAVFNDYVVNVINGSTPDPNAVSVINAANKRKFFIIIRASCISSSGSVNSQCSNIGTTGFKALVSRQIGLLVGMSTKDCTIFPDDVMCASSPSSAQFSDNSKLRFAAALNNSLESILLNSGYYD